MEPGTMMGLGALGGAVLGGLGGSKSPGKVTSVTDLPEWLMPYTTGMLNPAMYLMQQGAQGATPILNTSQDEMLKTIRGDYLNPETNPYLNQTFQQGASQIKSALSPKFGHMQAFGSGGNQYIGRSIADFGQNLFGNNYNQERNRQFGATTGGQNFAFEPFSQFKNLTNLGVSQQSQPYFTNPASNIMGGALTGAMMGRMFGGG